MIEILYTKFKRELPEVIWNKYLNLLPHDLRSRNQRYLRWKDRHSHLFGKLLLKKGFVQYGLGIEELSNLKYNKFGRPYLSNHNIDFNISHSGNFVVCVLGRNIRLGVDIEEIRMISFKDYKEVMNVCQWDEILRASEKTKSFFEFWTIKESVVKADSRGLSLPLNSIQIDKNRTMAKCQKNTWFLTNLNLDPRVAIFLATSSNLQKLKISYVDFYNERD